MKRKLGWAAVLAAAIILLLWALLPEGNVQPSVGGGIHFGSSGPLDPKSVTNEEGIVEHERAPVGPILVVGMPIDFTGSLYTYAIRPLTTKSGEVIRVDVPMARRRIDRFGVGGDLGFQLKRRDPNVDRAVHTMDVVLERPDGPAVGSGLRVGDRIVAIDGYDVRGWRSYLFGTLSRVPEGTTVTLGLERGVSVRITAGKPI